MPSKELAIIIRAKDEALKHINKLDKGMDNLRRSVFNVKTALGGLALGYGVKEISGDFLGAADSAEQYRVRLSVLLRSQEEGNRMFKEMADYASKVPFEYENVMGSATALSGVMKGGVDEVKEWMPLIGDLAATTGLSLEETTGQVIRMYSAGAASADMFRERGVLAMLGFKAGVSYSAEETRKKMMEEWKKADSQFRGATDKLAKTWAGQMSMISDKWYQFRNLVMDAGVFDALKDALGDINDEFEAWIKNNKDIIEQRVPEYVDKIKESISGLKDDIDGLVEFYEKYPGVVAGGGIGLIGTLLYGLKVGGILGVGAFIAAEIKRYNDLIDQLPEGEFSERITSGISASSKLTQEEIEKIVKSGGKISGSLKKELESIQTFFAQTERAAAKAGEVWDISKGGGGSTGGAEEIDEKVWKERIKLYEDFQKDLIKLRLKGIEQEEQLAGLQFQKDLAETVGHLELQKLAVEKYEITIQNIKKKYADETEAIVAEVLEGYKKYFADIVRESEKASKEMMDHVTNYADHEATLLARDEALYREIFGKELSEFNKRNEEMLANSKDTFDYMREMSVEAARSMQRSFSDFFFKGMKGEFKDLGDVAEAFRDSLYRIIADFLALRSAQGLFGKEFLAGKSSSIGGLIGSVFSIFTREKGGILPGGFRAFQSGGIINEPTFGLVGEGSRSEAVVPLPDNRSIPVKLFGSEKGGTTIYNVFNIHAVDGASVAKVLMDNKETIWGITAQGFSQNRPLRDSIKTDW